MWDSSWSAGWWSSGWWASGWRDRSRSWRSWQTAELATHNENEGKNRKLRYRKKSKLMKNWMRSMRAKWLRMAAAFTHAQQDFDVVSYAKVEWAYERYLEANTSSNAPTMTRQEYERARKAVVVAVHQLRQDAANHWRPYFLYKSGDLDFLEQSIDEEPAMQPNAPQFKVHDNDSDADGLGDDVSMAAEASTSAAAASGLTDYTRSAECKAESNVDGNMAESEAQARLPVSEDVTDPLPAAAGHSASTQPWHELSEDEAEAPSRDRSNDATDVPSTSAAQPRQECGLAEPAVPCSSAVGQVADTAASPGPAIELGNGTFQWGESGQYTVRLPQRRLSLPAHTRPKVLLYLADTKGASILRGVLHERFQHFLDNFVSIEITTGAASESQGSRSRKKKAYTLAPKPWLLDFVHALHEQHARWSGGILISGFSRGAAWAYELVLARPSIFAAAMLFAWYCRDSHDPRWLATSWPLTVPLVLAESREDECCAFPIFGPLVEEIFKRLPAAKPAVAWHVHLECGSHVFVRDIFLGKEASQAELTQRLYIWALDRMQERAPKGVSEVVSC